LYARRADRKIINDLCQPLRFLLEVQDILLLLHAKAAVDVAAVHVV